MPAETVKGKHFDGDKVAVHYNLHRCRVGTKPKKGESCFVVRQKGRVAGYVPSIAVEDAEFVVQPGGLKSIRKKGSRAVIAYVKGTGRDPGASDIKRKIANGKAVPVCFNPFKNDSFVNCKTGKPVKKAKVALFSGRTAKATTLGSSMSCTELRSAYSDASDRRSAREIRRSARKRGCAWTKRKS
jgi:hypothetical protein